MSKSQYQYIELNEPAPCSWCGEFFLTLLLRPNSARVCKSCWNNYIRKS
nr:MAG: hypothetical protein [Microvirus sp.]